MKHKTELPIPGPADQAPSGVPGIRPDPDSPNPELLAMPASLKRITEEDVAKATAVLTKYKDGKINLENRLIEDERWYQLQHQEFLRRNQPRKDANGNPIEQISPTSAWLFNTLANKHADAMDNYPEPIVLPREESDEEDAKMLSEILPVVQERNDYEQTYNDNAWEKLKHGTAAYGVFWDKDLENGLGDISVKRLDLLNVFWQPGIEDIQKSRNLFIVDLVDDDILAADYPEAARAGKLGNAIEVSKYIYDDFVDTSDKTLVVDWYYKVKNSAGRTTLHYAKFAGRTLLYASENDSKYAETGWYDHGMYPIVLDTLWKEKGTPAGFGYIAICKDPQLYIDRLGGCFLENAIAGAKPRHYVSEDSGINEEEFKDIRNSLVHVAGAINENKYQPIDAPPLSGNYIAFYETKINELKETASNRDFSSGGTTSGVTAAAAIAALQEAGNKQSRDNNLASYRADKKITIMEIELIRQFYDEARCFRITGLPADGEPGGFSYITYSNAGIKDRQIENPSGEEPFIRRPVFDIKVKAQKRNPYSQLSQNEQAKELYKLGAFNPEQAQPALLMLQMMDFEGIDTVREQVQQGQTLMNLLSQAIQQRDMLYMVVARLTGLAPEDVPAQAGGGNAEGAPPNREQSSSTSLENAASNAQALTMTPYAQKVVQRTNSTKPKA